jgi:hypothetical protein
VTAFQFTPRARGRRPALAATVLACLFSGLALCASSASATTVHPAGDSFTVMGPGVNFTGPTGAFVCGEPNGGTATVPVKNYAPGQTGVIPVSFSTPPTYTCPAGTTVTASGIWTMNLVLGPPTTADRTVPVGGLTVKYAAHPNCKIVNEKAIALDGYWQNGFTSPGKVASMNWYWGTYTGSWQHDGGVCPQALTKTTAPMSIATSIYRIVKDTTNPAVDIVVGP